MKRVLACVSSLVLLAGMFGGCAPLETDPEEQTAARNNVTESSSESLISVQADEESEYQFETIGLSGGEFDYSSVPEYSGDSSYIVNDDIPFFTDDDLTTESYLNFGELDELGRCTVAQTCLGTDTLAPEDQERGSIGMIKPSGWVMKKYDCVEGNYCVNRAHLVAYSLSNTLADERNLITGTRYLNLEMLYGTEYEVLNYIQDTQNHVLYRVTPIFLDDESMCSGILMEGMSVEDNGAGILFCRFYYNVQPGLEFDYQTGDSSYTGIFLDTDSPAVNTDEIEETEVVSNAKRAELEPSETELQEETASGDNEDADVTYICNTNSMKFHRVDCANAARIYEKNRLDTTKSRNELILEGYVPAGCCNP